MSPDAASETDAALTARAVKGDRAAFDRFVQRHQDGVYRFIRRYAGDADEAYDLVQETFVAAWQALARYDPARPAAVWLRRIALNKCRDWSRRRAVRRFFYRASDIDTVNPAAAESEDTTIADARLARLDMAIAALPQQLKEPLLLTVFEGLSHIEAGKALGISSKAVETRVYRARKQLANTISDGADDETSL